MATWLPRPSKKSKSYTQAFPETFAYNYQNTHHISLNDQEFFNMVGWAKRNLDQAHNWDDYWYSQKFIDDHYHDTFVIPGNEWDDRSTDKKIADEQFINKTKNVQNQPLSFWNILRSAVGAGVGDIPVDNPFENTANSSGYVTGNVVGQSIVQEITEGIIQHGEKDIETITKIEKAVIENVVKPISDAGKKVIDIGKNIIDDIDDLTSSSFLTIAFVGVGVLIASKVIINKI